MGCAFKSSRRGGSIAHRGLIILQPSALTQTDKRGLEALVALSFCGRMFFFSPSDMQIHLDVWTLGMARYRLKDFERPARARAWQLDRLRGLMWQLAASHGP